MRQSFESNDLNHLLMIHKPIKKPGYPIKPDGQQKWSRKLRTISSYKM